MTNGVVLDLAVERVFELLTRGDRAGTRHALADLERGGLSPREVLAQVLWPVHELLDRAHRRDKTTELSYRLATRVLRMVAAETGARVERRRALGRSVLLISGKCETEELGAQVTADLLEHEGYTVVFAGGGVPRDEMIAYAFELRPDVLCLFCSSPEDLPAIRQTIDHIRERRAIPDTQIVVGGGVFNRASGLGEEIGADLWASDPLDLALCLSDEPERRATADQRTVGKQRKAA